MGEPCRVYHAWVSHRTFVVGHTPGYNFAVRDDGGVEALPRPDGSVPVIGGQLDLSSKIALPTDWTPVDEATGNNARISDGKELYAGAGFGDPLIEGQVDDVLWALGDERQKEQGRLLEVGCGPGFLLEALQRRLPAWQLVGVDPSPDSCSQARSRGVECHLGFLDSVDVEGQFTAFVIMGNFQLHSDPADTLRQLAALAAPGARLYLDSKNPLSTARRLARRLMTTPLLRDLDLANSYAAHALHGLRTAMPQSALIRMCEDTGWTVDSIRTTPPRLLRFDNTHRLSRGAGGHVWRALDGLDRLVGERSWIQISAVRTP